MGVAFETTGWLPPCPTTNNWLGLSGPRVANCWNTACARLTDSCWLVAQPEPPGRVAFGVPFDADDLLGIRPGQLGSDRIEQRQGGGLQIGAAALEELRAGHFDANHVAVRTHFNARQVDRRQGLTQAVVGRDGGSGAAARGGHHGFGLFFGLLLVVAQLCQLGGGAGNDRGRPPVDLRLACCAAGSGPAVPGFPGCPGRAWRRGFAVLDCAAAARPAAGRVAGSCSAACTDSEHSRPMPARPDTASAEQRLASGQKLLRGTDDIRV